MVLVHSALFIDSKHALQFTRTLGKHLYVCYICVFHLKSLLEFVYLFKNGGRIEDILSVQTSSYGLQFICQHLTIFPVQAKVCNFCANISLQFLFWVQFAISVLSFHCSYCSGYSLEFICQHLTTVPVQFTVCNFYAFTSLQFLFRLQFGISVPTPHYSSCSGYTLGLMFNQIFTTAPNILI
jgi:hypothetical protein